jgi:hypothetical protein
MKGKKKNKTKKTFLKTQKNQMNGMFIGQKKLCSRLSTLDS